MKALIVTGQLDAPELLHIDQNDYDCVVCADRGLLIAQGLDLKPDLLIGDYDSMELPGDPDMPITEDLSELPGSSDLIRLPRVKDMTDSEAAIDLAVSRGFTDLTVLGGLGGRFDHTMGNIGMLKKYLGRLEDLRLMDGQNLVFLRAPGRYTVPPAGFKYLGLIAYDSPCTGLCVSGTRYPLQDFTLTNDTSLTVSNEITADTAEISFMSGTLLVIQSRDRG